MNINSLRNINRNPALNSAREAYEFTAAKEAADEVHQCFDTYAGGMAELDNKDGVDFDPTPGSVVLAASYVKDDQGRERHVSVGEIKFDPESGKVDTFKVVDRGGSMASYELSSPDTLRGRNPQFTAILRVL